MEYEADVICVGSVLWDVIGRTNKLVSRGGDVGGYISRIPGGVAFNIAQNLVNLNLKPCLLGFLGNDNEGMQLLSNCQELGINTDYIYRSDDFSTDNYVAIEDSDGVVAAIADAHSLEKVGSEILKPLKTSRFNNHLKAGRLPLIIDGNLKPDLLIDLSLDPFFDKFDVKLVPASPGKAHRHPCWHDSFISRFTVQIFRQHPYATARRHKTFCRNGFLRNLRSNVHGRIADADDKNIFAPQIMGFKWAVIGMAVHLYAVEAVAIFAGNFAVPVMTIGNHQRAINPRFAG